MTRDEFWTEGRLGQLAVGCMVQCPVDFIAKMLGCDESEVMEKAKELGLIVSPPEQVH